MKNDLPLKTLPEISISDDENVGCRAEPLSTHDAEHLVPNLACLTTIVKNLRFRTVR